jgi:hypothetical protein
MHGQRSSASLLMLKQLAWQPKGENKLAIARLNPNQVLARDGDRGSGTNSPMQKAPDAKCAFAALLSTEKFQEHVSGLRHR